MRSSNAIGSPFNDQLGFLSRQGGLTSTSGVSNALLGSLSQPVELIELDSLLQAPAVGISSGATLAGAPPFDEFCQPEDFTCD